MKNKILFLLLMITTALSWSLKAEGQTTYYVVNDNTERSLSTIATGPEYTLQGPGDKLTFDAYKKGGVSGGTGPIRVEQKVSNNWSEILEQDVTTSSKNYSVYISHQATAIRFKTTIGATYTKYYKNVKVTRATTLAATSSSINFGVVKYGNSQTNSITVNYNNTYSGAVLTGSCTNPAFTVTRTEMGETGSKGITITYNANSLGDQTGTVTLTMGTDGKNNNVTTTFTVSGTGVIDYNYSANTGVNRETFGTASVFIDGGALGTTANTSVLDTTEPSVEKTVSFSATANTGYEFVGWGTTADATSYESTANPYNYTMTATLSAPSQSKTLYAIFKPVFNFSATATSSNETLGTATATVANDKILGDVDATQAETAATFTATPANDCVFKGWYEASDYSGEPVSTNANYNVTLTNSAIGSTATKTLYALFKKKQNLQWADPNLDVNLVNGQEYSSAATVTSGKTITYTSDNHNAVTIDADGTIHAVGLGDAHVTASVAGDDIYQPETITRDFSVGEIKQATFTPAWGEGTSTDIKVDGSTSIALTNIANDETFTMTIGTEGVINVTRNGNTLNISAVQAGTTTLTLSQQGSAVLAGNQVTYTITVSRYPNTFALADETKAMKVEDVWNDVVTNNGNGNTTVSYSIDGIATYDAANNKITAIAEGSTVITFAQEETATHEGVSKTLNVTVTKVVNPLSVTLGSTEMDVEGTINLVVAGRVSDGATHAVITDMQLSSEVNNGTDVITYNNNVITACNAGTAKIKFTQDATAKYTAYESETYTITVNKLANAITVTLDGEQKNSKNVGRGANVVLGYTSPSDGAYNVSLTSGSNDVATIAGNTITAGDIDGTNIWTITQAETYKYAAATTSVRIKVNSVAEEEGYVLQDLAEHSWSTISNYTTGALSGPGETLTFQAKRTNILGVGSSTNFYAQYSTDGGSTWTRALTLNLSSADQWYDFSCEVPENTTNVRFVTETGATGNKQVRNIRVTRKTYVRATASQTNLGEVYTDKTASTTFNVSYSSTNGGNIEVLSNNPRFSVDNADIPVQSAKRRAARDLLNETESITVTDHSDNVGNPVVITVTYTPDPEHLGDDAGTITISDRYYSTELTFTAFAKKYPTTISRGSNTATETTVDGTIDNAFAFTGTTISAPSASSDDDFYYTIASTYSSDVHNEEGVITYDPATNTVTGRNAGTARLTIYQKSTNLYAATSQTFDFTVSKLANPVNIALSSTSIAVDGTATVALTSDDGKGAVSVAYSNIAFTNEALNREGGLLAYNEENKTLTGVNAGTATVTITQAETHKYLAKSQQFSVTVNKLPQTLTWDREVETTMQVGAVIDNNTATSAVGLTPVTYTSSNTAAIEVDAESGRLTAKAVGANITITATQAGNYKYAPATITRQFSVFNKKTPAFTPDEAHYDSETKTITVDWEGTATITVKGVGADAAAGFTITNGNDAVISVVRNDATITISGLTIGNTTLTLTQAASDDFLAKTEIYTVNVVMPTDYLTLDPTVEPSIEAGTYRKIMLHRTLKAGYSTIALPFDVTVETLVGDGYNAETDWVAQLSIVAYNTHDGYSLYFKKSTEIVANEPYILHLGNPIVNPVYRGSFVVTEATATEHVAEKGVNADGHSYLDWAMHSNYTPDFDMEGHYGVVNSQNAILLGGAGSTIGAFTAYFRFVRSIPEPEPETESPRRVTLHYLDAEEMDAFLTGLDETLTDTDDTTVIYDLSGRRMNAPRQGVIIKNGRKTWNR